jgi:molybdopterin-containing oxidoreductase family iron-sulfur binding subunit
MNPRKDLPAKLALLQKTRGRKYWRSLEELAGSDEFQELMRQEFPEQADVWPESLSRRQFLALMGASLALGGLSGCSVRPAPPADIVPYVNQPEGIVPGKPLFFATAMTLGCGGVGLLIESHLGRPTKIEGNPDHPSSLGATDAIHQASILTFYDPDRSQTVTVRGETSTWDDALGTVPVRGVASLRQAMAEQRSRKGAGLRLLTESVVSPTLHQQIRDLVHALPEARWHQYEPINTDNARRASRTAYGQVVNTLYDFRKADVVLALDADFLSASHDPGSLRYVADFTSGRRVRTTEADAGKAKMNRLYVAEPGLTCTGAKADNRLALPAHEIEDFARGLAERLNVVPGSNSVQSRHARWVEAIAEDLERHRGRSLAVAGKGQPESVHLLALAINHHLGNVGHTVLHTSPVEADPVDQVESLRELVDDMRNGQVRMLVIVGGNPAYSAPADFELGKHMAKVPLRVHLGLFQDETARLCHWHLPEAHYLEAWSDTRAFDGTASIVQPLMLPLYQGRSAHELLSALLYDAPAPGYDTVRNYWASHWKKEGKSGQAAEELWQTALHDGVIAGTAFPQKNVSLKPGWQEYLPKPAAEPRLAGLEIVFQPDPMVHDGRFANNAWLQECPRPASSLTWENAAFMSPRTAESLGVRDRRYAHGGEHGGYTVPVVELRVGERVVEAPVWVLPGHADDSVTVNLGYGRQYAGRVGGSPDNRVGFDAYKLRMSTAPWFATDVQVRKTGKEHVLACTQEHQLMENREVVRSATLDDYHRQPRFAAGRKEETPRAEIQQARQPLTLYPPSPAQTAERKWGMSIDLTACTGCKACIVACQAENNIPVVGKDQVSRGRAMHWLRVDLYNGSGSEPVDMPTEFNFQPVPCMHCENAPCEYVCPVGATVHSEDGLNDMVYQRCVGTRFCSNNCPYKVRRFNFLFYADFSTPSTRLQYNPDVTVRSRGVMEKCSYCVQRIRRADITAQVENRSIVDGEVVTACQAACPAQAILFGDIKAVDARTGARSKVSQWKESPLHYALLADLNTEPRTTYLAALRNPNPDLVERNA